MNKNLFKLLIVGFALANIQGASAAKLPNEKERDVNRTPKPLKKVQLRTPNAPVKPRNIKNYIEPQAEGVLIPAPVVSKLRFQ